MSTETMKRDESHPPRGDITHPRRQAIADGAQVEVTDRLTLTMWDGVPVAFTRRAWDRYVRVPAWAVPGTSELGHVWDILAFLKGAMAEQPRHGPVLTFRAPIRNHEPDGEEEVVRFEAVFGADDEGCRYLTLRLPGE